MKKFIIAALLLLVSVPAFLQVLPTIISFRSAYPTVVGCSETDSLSISHNGMVMENVDLDSLPVYEIGQIGEQTVRYSETGHSFYVKADSLYSNLTTYRCTVDSSSLPEGSIQFDASTQKFSFHPTPYDYNNFVVTFIATDGRNTVEEEVEFILVPPVPSQVYAFNTQGTMPSGEDYTLVAENALDSTLFNLETRQVYSFSISGRDVVFDNGLQNKVWGLSLRQDINDLTIYAERLIIRSPLAFPQTDITIYAREIRFEDNGSTIASISTTPTQINTMSNGTGINGADAGDIHLYVQTIAAGGSAQRFILNGGNGQNTNRNGTPGNGGNGGTMYSTIDVQGFCDFARGSCGVRYDTNSCIIGCGQIGQNGHFELTTAQSYLHPYWIAAGVRHVNDAFINNYTIFAKQQCDLYYTEINQFLGTGIATCNTEEEVQLRNSLVEIENMLYNLNQNLDYFGNPVGWTPMLSFESLISTYQSEIDRAMPTLYMYYWLTRVDQTHARRVAAATAAATQAQNNLVADHAALNSFVAEIPILQDKATVVTNEINTVCQKLEDLKNRLMSKARHNVKKRNRIKKAFSITKAVANCIPVYGTAISAGMEAVAASGVLDHLTGEDIDYSEALNAVGNTTVDPNFFSNLQSSLTSAQNALGGDFSALKDAYKSLNTALKPLINSVKSVNNILKHGSAPASQVELEFNRLKAESAEWAALEADLNELNKKKEDLLASINELFINMGITMNDISNEVVALDAFRRDAFIGNSKRDLNAMQYIEKMQQRAKSRLLKYHYYVRKAYEYRMLEPYTGEFNLNGMFDRLENLGLSLDSVVSPDVYNTLSSIYKDMLSEVFASVIDRYVINYSELSSEQTYALSQRELDILNAGGSITINPQTIGIFDPEEEDIRIVDLGVQHMDVHTEGTIGNSGYMDIVMTHSGISTLRKNGQLFWFDHRALTTTNPHTYGARYNALTGEITSIRPSASTASLLSYITGIENTNSLMLFTRPSAWADISLCKKVLTLGGADVILDSLVIKIRYDFVRRPSQLRNIDITTNGGLMAYIACSESDVNGRTNGAGNLHRSYTSSSRPVTFSAIERYGRYHFVNWTDRGGRVVSTNPELTISRSNDGFYRANYEEYIPVLSVPDTIKVGYDGGEYSVLVSNIGRGDIAMDWEVSDSLSTWVHLDGIAEGVDSGYFTFTYEANALQERRIDSIEIYAPETDAMYKVVYIVQTDEEELAITDGGLKEVQRIKVYPNPVKDVLTIGSVGIKLVRMYSSMGQLVEEVDGLGADMVTVDMSRLPRGIYILSVEDHFGLKREKVFKAK